MAYVKPSQETDGIQRRQAREISLGNLKIGGTHPIRVQSMATHKTSDVPAVVQQIRELEAVGCEIVRVSVNDQEALSALPAILSQITIPLIADVHFDYRMALGAMRTAVAGVRINPGNIGAKWKTIEVVRMAAATGKTLRIGVNSGSLEKTLIEKYGSPSPQALVESALSSIALMEGLGFYEFKVSIKTSDVLTNLAAYSLLASRTDAPLHVGVTEAGTRHYGLVKSAVGIGGLLLAGIGDTIRVSLAAPPSEEVRAAFSILKCLGLRNDSPEVIACPTCGRTDIDVAALAERVEQWAAGVRKNIKIAVMGCSVNGPGEAKEADIGIAGGKGEGLIYKRGQPLGKVPADQLFECLVREIEQM